MCLFLARSLCACVRARLCVVCAGMCVGIISVCVCFVFLFCFYISSMFLCVFFFVIIFFLYIQFHYLLHYPSFKEKYGSFFQQSPNNLLKALSFLYDHLPFYLLHVTFKITCFKVSRDLNNFCLNSVSISPIHDL